MPRTPTVVALIPARSGSVRVKNKNVRKLGGRPLIAYTINSARGAGIFAEVVVSTNCEEIAAVAKEYGASVPFLRPAEFAGELSPDVKWVQHALKALATAGNHFDAFAILRPTSPFRKPETIRRAWDQFIAEDDVDSLRAVQLCREHPMKMWVIRGRRLLPLFPFGSEDPPWHSSAYQSLPDIYVQNASLEIAWMRVPLDKGSIAGDRIIPFITKGREGFDINSIEDWELAEKLISEGLVTNGV